MGYKKALYLILCVAVACSFCGCENKNKAEQETTHTKETIVAIHAGDDNVYLDEAMYYAYTAQATYETYYLTEGKEIDWKSKVQDDISMESFVKTTVVDEICRRQCMYRYGIKNNIVLSEEDKQEIEIKLENYYKESDGELLSKIGISKESLQKVFEKQMIAEKTENVLETAEKGLANVTYKKWKEENTVTTEKQWETITFSKPIFTLKDLG